MSLPAFVPGDRVRPVGRANSAVYEVDSVVSPVEIYLRGVRSHYHPSKLVLVQSLTDSARAEAAALAAQFLGRESLAARGSDSLDFVDCHVGNLESALVAAFFAGRRSAGGAA